MEFIEFRVFRKKNDGNAEKAYRGYCPFSGLGRDRGFLYRNRVFWLYVMTRFFVSRHGSQATSDCRVTTGVFLVTTKLFFSSFLSRQGSSLCHNSVFFLYHDRGSLFATETAKVGGQGCHKELGHYTAKGKEEELRVHYRLDFILVLVLFSGFESASCAETSRAGFLVLLFLFSIASWILMKSRQIFGIHFFSVLLQL